MTQVTMKALLETGVHFGHRTRKWNPKMDTFIFTERNGIHIIDLQQTLRTIREAYDLVRDTVADGGTILFVGTKRQAQETIAREAARCGMPYVNERWLGGTMTNWQTIRERIQYLDELEQRRDEGEFDLLTKKEALTLTREIEKLNVRLGGIRIMDDLPNLLFVVDVMREYTAVHEANILRIPVIAMVDTNADPDLIDYVIPSNDDAIRAIKLVTSVIADAVMEGKAMWKEDLVEDVSEAYEEDEYDYEEDEDETDEDFLGQATLAKLKSGELSFEGEEAKEEADEDEEADEEEAEEEEEAEVEPDADEDEDEAADEDEADKADEDEEPEDDETDEDDEAEDEDDDEEDEEAEDEDDDEEDEDED